MALVEGDFEAGEERGGHQAVEFAAHLGNPIGIQFAERDPAKQAPDIGVQKTSHETAEQMLEQNPYRRPGSPTHEHRREVFDVGPDQGADDALSHAFEGARAEMVEGAQAGEQHEVRRDWMATSGKEEDLPDIAVEHAAGSELTDGAAEAVIERGGGPVGGDFAEQPQHERAGVDLGETSLGQA